MKAFSHKKYNITTTFMALVATPVAIGIAVIGTVLLFSLLGFVGLYALPVLALILIWVPYAKKAILPPKASQVFFPILLSFGYYALLWIIGFGLSGYRYDSIFFERVYAWLTRPYFAVNLFLTLGDGYGLFPLVCGAATVVMILSVIITCGVCKKKIIYDKKFLAYVAGTLCLCGIIGCQFYARGINLLDGDSYAERVYDEVNTYDYQPFSGGKNQALKAVSGTPAIAFYRQYPKLDGATAAFPVYASMVQELYRGLDYNTVDEYVSCSKTDGAYERLINGEIDIFFGAQPSRQQLEAAAEKGIEFIMTPIAKEAFVFFVNRENPVGSLTLTQIQDIYQKKVTNWSQVGGNDESIIPFQRPENSGSQTIMQAYVMRDKALPAPLWEEYSIGMGSIISQVAQYRNYSAAIGYSFRFFATGMNPNDNIKLLAVNGIEPTVENIREGTYPFTVEVYAVTAGTTNENAAKLIEWILSEQGQQLIEDCGYVGR